MRYKYLFNTAMAGLKANKSRSMLTMLGIVIGIAAIILIMALGQGAQNLILDQIRGFGSRTIDIEPGRMPSGPSDIAEMLTDSLKQRDFDSLKNLQGVGKITPTVFQAISVAYKDETERGTLIGASDLLAEILDVYPAEGNYFTEDDIRQYASVAVIGSELKQNLFGPESALGQKIKMKNRAFKVVGVLNPKGSMVGMNVDKMAIVPYTTAQKYLLGINYFNGGIIIKAESEDAVAPLIEDVKYVLRENHNISDPKKDDFHIVTQAAAMERVGMVTGILTALLGSVAAISLVVGGIGIMNIMLVSVTERTREIGLRKAVGATEKNILMQFLLEAVALTGVGGFAGIILGTLLSFFASLVLTKAVGLDWRFVFPLSAAIIGFAVAAMVGLAFGIYPARKASQKSPIEALRYE
jgi:putative ABC transport system permease protein